MKDCCKHTTKCRLIVAESGLASDVAKCIELLHKKNPENRYLTTDIVRPFAWCWGCVCWGRQINEKFLFWDRASFSLLASLRQKANRRRRRRAPEWGSISNKLSLSQSAAQQSTWIVFWRNCWILTRISIGRNRRAHIVAVTKECSPYRSITNGLCNKAPTRKTQSKLESIFAKVWSQFVRHPLHHSISNSLPSSFNMKLVIVFPAYRLYLLNTRLLIGTQTKRKKTEKKWKYSIHRLPPKTQLSPSYFSILHTPIFHTFIRFVSFDVSFVTLFGQKKKKKTSNNVYVID